MTQNTKRIDTGRMTRIGMMSAIAVILGFFPEIPMAFFAPWLKLDFSYVPMLLTGFSISEGTFSMELLGAMLACRGSV